MFSQAQARDRNPPKIEHIPVTSAPAGKDLVIKAKMTDPSGLFDPLLYYRHVGESDFHHASFTDRGNSNYEAVIPIGGKIADVEYFIEAFDGNGNGPARVGTPEKPIRVRVLALPADSDNPDQAQADTSPADDTSGPQAHTSGAIDDEQMTAWLIAGGAVTAVVLLAAGSAAAVWMLTQEPEPAPPGTVTVRISAPPPYSSELSSSTSGGR